MENYLKETKILDYSNQEIQNLIKEKQWMKLDTIDRVKSIYNFVRDEIKMGFSVSDDIPASQVLKERYGQCNTKSTLLMALLRVTNIPNRIHGFTVGKELFRGVLKGVWYGLTPKNILHSWVEVYVNDKWYFLEGVILDKAYLTSLQKENMECKTTFCGYGAYTDNFQDPQIEWNLNNTYIQEKGINQDFGLFDSPDQFYAKHSQKLNFIKRFIFQKIVRKKMNDNVNKLRDNGC
jgi:transglutaminase-like putative cysteine protease